MIYMKKLLKAYVLTVFIFLTALFCIPCLDFYFDMNADAGIYIAESDNPYTQADIYRKRGYKKIKEAKAALYQNLFNEAEEILQEARENFSLSLSFRDDPELQSFSDMQIFSLTEEIIRIKTNYVIENVRNNLKKAGDFYNNGKYSEAETLLIKSRNMWRTVNTEDNKEIRYRLKLVQAALSVRSGRVFSETDPHYSEMKQVIKLAREDYLTGKRLASEGKTVQAAGYLQSAEEKLMHVTDPYPMNQEANILSLEILKIKDPENFDSLFSEKYELAKKRININPSESLIRLKDLAHVNPDYPGIKKAIYDAEIKLGIRNPPSDPVKIRESENLYRKAEAIVFSNVRSNYPAALEYLNQAFLLNPDNEKITVLKDRVQSEMGGSTTVVLSSYAQEQYRLAEQEYLNGNYYAAYAIVNKLLQDKNNRNYYPLLDLKKRIDSKI